MSGYAARTHPAEGTSQALWVKALALEDAQGHRALLVTADLCGITQTITDRVGRELERRHSIPRRSLMVNVSHTHSGPVVEGYADSALARDYLESQRSAPDGWVNIVTYRERLERSMVEAAESALTQLRPATLQAGADSAGFAVNRRNNVEKEVPALRAEGRLRGPVDHAVPVLVVRSAEGPIAIVMAYACHNTTLNGYVWSGDYAGHAQVEIERRHPGAVALFALGCGGDINPLPRRRDGLVENYGAQLADAVDRALAKPTPPLAAAFASAYEQLALEFSHQPNTEELEMALKSEKPGLRVWAKQIQLDRSHGGQTMAHSYPIQAWRLGDLQWVALGGEVVVDYALRLKREVNGELWVLGYSNDVMAYIPSERVLQEGGYEGATSMISYCRPGPWSPGLENKIVGKAFELLKANGHLR